MKRMAEGPQPDLINEPPHYNQGEIECIDAIKAATGAGFEYALQANVIKYLWRYRDKDHPMQDLLKARWYLEELIELHKPKHD